MTEVTEVSTEVLRVVIVTFLSEMRKENDSSKVFTCCDEEFECYGTTVKVTPFAVTRVMVLQLMWRNAPTFISNTEMRLWSAGS